MTAVIAEWNYGTMCLAWPRVFLAGSSPSRAEPPASHDKHLPSSLWYFLILSFSRPNAWFPSFSLTYFCSPATTHEVYAVIESMQKNNELWRVGLPLWHIWIIFDTKLIAIVSPVFLHQLSGIIILLPALHSHWLKSKFQLTTIKGALSSKAPKPESCNGNKSMQASCNFCASWTQQLFFVLFFQDLNKKRVSIFWVRNKAMCFLENVNWQFISVFLFFLGGVLKLSGNRFHHSPLDG